MITDEKISEFNRRFKESQQLYRILPDSAGNRERVAKDITRIGEDVFGPDWSEFRGWLDISFGEGIDSRKPKRAKRNNVA